MPGRVTPAAEQQELFAIVDSTKNDIVVKR